MKTKKVNIMLMSQADRIDIVCNLLDNGIMYDNIYLDAYTGTYIIETTVTKEQAYKELEIANKFGALLVKGEA